MLIFFSQVCELSFDFTFWVFSCWWLCYGDDEYLLSVAGGVYSGMSGSPIIQDNKIIGAVTHVKVDNIKQGYGLYASNMYQRLESGNKQPTKKERCIEKHVLFASFFFLSVIQWFVKLIYFCFLWLCEHAESSDCLLCLLLSYRQWSILIHARIRWGSCRTRQRLLSWHDTR